VHRAAGVDEYHRTLAYLLRLDRAVRIRARLVQQHQRELMRATELPGGGDHEGEDVRGLHAGMDAAVDIP